LEYALIVILRITNQLFDEWHLDNRKIFFYYKKSLNAMMKRSNQCRPVERVAHRLKGDLGAELTKVASEQVVNKAPCAYKPSESFP